MLYYQIALTNVPFDNSYKNVIHFEDRSEQETFFNVSSLFSSSTPNVNFNVGSLYATNVSFDGIPTDSINELLSKNYCIIKDNSPNKTLNYYYYFIKEARQDNGERLLLSLELDIFQTYYIDITFGDCLINKAHLNRFIEKTGDSTKVLFDGSVNSKLFEREDIQNVAKRLTKRTRLNINNHEQTPLDEWLDEYIYAWVYVYVDPTHTYNASSTSGTDYTTKFGTLKHKSKSFSDPVFSPSSLHDCCIPSNISCLCFPIFRKFTSLNVYSSNGTDHMEVDQNAFEYFLNANSDYSYVYAIKVSYVPPFDVNNLNYTFVTIPETPSYPEYKTLRITADDTFFNINNVRAFGFRSGSVVYAMLKVSEQENTIYTQNYTTNDEFEFLKSSIIGSNKNTKFNPKLLSSDYKEIKITDSTENSFSYDLQKLNKSEFKVLCSESFTPDTTKRYLRIDNSDNGVYISETNNNLTGIVISNDDSLIMPTTAYASMLAQNKNFFLQNSVNRGIDMQKSLLSAGSSVISGNAGIGTVTGLIGSALDIHKAKITENLTVDNLKNAPASIQGAQGNVIFTNDYSEYGIFIEEYDILPNEKEMLNDYMCMFGYTYNRIDNIKNVDNIRKYYNYVRADVETISGTTVNISEKVHEKFKELFARGVRFWNVVNNAVNYSYAKENYEKWLEE